VKAITAAVIGAVVLAGALFIGTDQLSKPETEPAPTPLTEKIETAGGNARDSGTNANPDPAGPGSEEPDATLSNPAMTTSGGQVVPALTPSPAPTERTLTVETIWRVSGEPAEGTTITLTRFIRDSWTSSVETAIDTMQVATDARGRAQLTYMSAWTGVHLEALHIDSALHEIDLEPAVATQRVTIELERGASIAETVFYEESGQPAVDAEVRLNKIIRGGVDPVIGRVRTDARGNYIFHHLRPNQVKLKANEGQYLYKMIDDSSAAFNLQPGQNVKAADIFIYLGGAVAGRVVEQGTGTPIEGVTISGKNEST
jgi:5-hydroxyisourate hydrolase-like protein (transthyretin family)